jgi:S1-C subfamily serine protease
MLRRRQSIVTGPRIGRAKLPLRNCFFPSVLLSLAVPFWSWVGYDYVRLALSDRPTPQAVMALGDTLAMEQTAKAVFKDASPVVLMVFGIRRPSRHRLAEVSLASGFVWDGADHVLTTSQVITGVDQIRVRFSAERVQRAIRVGAAPRYGVAVLRVPGASRNCRPLAMGSSDGLKVGQAVFAIGNPFGLSATLRQGLVSALGQQLPVYAGLAVRGLIQTDAPINPGNSGGPLLDSAGRLIGVSLAVVFGADDPSGVSFAVPIDVVNAAVAGLILRGREQSETSAP